MQIQKENEVADDKRTELFTIALVQMDPQRADVVGNRQRIVAKLEEAAQNGAQLVVFPECALSGYVFDSASEALPASESVPGETSEVLNAVCRRHNIHAIVGLLERDGDTLYNSALVASPQGAQVYRKCHLPVLGIDRYVGSGQELPIFALPFARVGVLICYDIRFPEAVRSLTLRGADIVVVPTNWPQGADSAPEFLTRARAWENRIYIAACNRVGVEQGTRFIGRSQVVAPDGTFLAQADGTNETTLYAEIDVRQARQKKVVLVPGVFELDPVGGRRPELYGDLTTL